MKKHIYSILLLAFFSIGFTASTIEDWVNSQLENPEDGNDPNTDSENAVVNISGVVNVGEDLLPLFNDCKVSTLSDLSDIKNGKFEVKANQNNCVQTFFVENDEGKVYMMARKPIAKGEQLIVDIESTALGLISLHPLFSVLEKSVYDEINNYIKESELYESYKAEIAKAVENHQDLLTDNNTLLYAFNDLLEDLLKNIDVGEYAKPNLAFVDDVMTRARGANLNPYPLEAKIVGNKLILNNTNLSPSYYGSVKKADGQETPISVLSSTDKGWWEWIHIGQIQRGKETTFTFTSEGEYHFHLSCTNELATFDFYTRLTMLAMSCIGFDTSVYASSTIQITQTVANTLCSTMGNLSDGSMEPLELFNTVLSTTCDAIQNSKFDDINKSTFSNIRKFAQRLGKFLSGYGTVKGGVNIIERIAFAINAPDPIDFCLCYYNGEVSTCTTTRLHKVNGCDNQDGYANQRLLLPLKVYVEILGEDGFYYPLESYEKVKFEVTSGGGFVSNEIVGTNSEDRIASTYWTLGDSGNQEVKASVIDMVTGKEISEPVYFTATLKDNAALTVTLDWHKLSGNTDIDLHVTDPFGEEIYYAHMNSASGGNLDWDDVVGPGPEHIYWTSAPSGAYLVQVHYYESESKAPTTCSVTINTQDKQYGPFTRTIGYHDLITIGVINLPSGDFVNTRHSNIDGSNFIEKKDVEHNVLYPFAKYKK